MSEFIPLTAQRIPSRVAQPVEPVTWYTIVAPRFPVRAIPPGDEIGAEDGPDGARIAVFGSIEVVAEEERQRRGRSEPEPDDIRQMRRDTVEEARRLVAEARAQSHGLEEESRAQGYRAGYDTGFAAGEQEAIRQLTQRANDEREAYQQDLSEFLSRTEETSRRVWIDMEPEIVGLVFDIARKVIKMEVEMNRSAAIEIVKNALRRVADTTSIRIRVHADDLQTVRANREDLYTLVDNIRQVEIVEDRRVGQGGCIVETEAGTIDARIETQIDEVRKLLQQTTHDRGLG